MKAKVLVLALTTILSLNLSSVAFASDNKMSCKKQAKSMKFKTKKERAEFIKTCNEPKPMKGDDINDTPKK